MDISSLITQINWLAVIIITVLSFALGALWHSKLLFGKAWTEEVNPSHEKSKAHMGMVFGLSALLHFIAASALSAWIGEQSNAVAGLVVGLTISLFFVSTAIGVTYIFSARSLKLFLIDAGYYIVFFAIAGIILGAW